MSPKIHRHGISRFTTRLVDSIKPPADGRRIEVFGPDGLTLRVNPSGRRVWNFIYRHDGRVRRLTIGPYPGVSVKGAHARHRQAMAAHHAGMDPATEHVEERRRRRTAKTIRELVADFIDLYSRPRKRTWREDQRILERDVVPAWGARKVHEIQRADVARLLDSIATRAPIGANRILACIRKMFAWALTRDLIPFNPASGIPRPGVENPRHRFLSDAELAAFVSGLGDQDSARLSEQVRLGLWLLLATGQRPSEITGARWDEMEIEAGWWTISGERVKNRLPHRVPLAPLAIRVLEEARETMPESSWVFPSVRGGKPIVITSLNQAIQQNRERWGIDHFTAHDVRRSVATGLAATGFSRFVIGRILNHVEPGVIRVYDRHSYDRDKREALEAWSAKLETMIAQSRLGGQRIGKGS